MSRAPMQSELRTNPPTKLAIRETKPASHASEMFISPRVLDEAAFERFAETLRAMVDDGARTEAGVREAVRAAKRVLEAYQEAGVGGLADRVDDLRAAIERSRGTERSLARAREEAASKTQRLERVAIAASDAIEAQRAGLERVIESVRSQTNAARIELQAQLEQSTTQANERGNQTLGELEDKARELIDGVIRGAVEDIETRVGHARAVLDETAATFEAQSGKARDELELIERRVKRVHEKLNAIDDERLERLEGLVSKLSGGPRRPGLERLAKQMGDEMPRALASIEQLGSLIDQTDVARDTLADAIIKGSKAVDSLEARAAAAAGAARGK